MCAVLDLGIPTAELRVNERTWETVCIITLYLFLHIVKDKIKKLIVSLEHTRHFWLGAQFGWLVVIVFKTDVVGTFTTSCKLDTDASIDVLG